MAIKEVTHKNKKIEEQHHISKLQSLYNYFVNARMELRKVSWPTRKETITTGIVVFVVVVIVSLFLGVVDFTISGLIRYILSL